MNLDIPSAPPACPSTRRKAKGEFLASLVAMAGHDLRQPLQAITSAHEILATMLDNDKQRQELAHATAAAARLGGMLNQLVEALQFPEPSQEAQNVPVPLRPLFEDLSAQFTALAQIKEITLEFTNTWNAALSHPVLLSSILRNLLHNAISYTPCGGSVSVTSRRCGRELQISVQDTGKGICAEALATIFEAFQRADDTRTDGLGLGLFIVKHAAEQLGHRINVHSDVGSGSCFTVVTRAAPLRHVPADTGKESEARLVRMPTVTEIVGCDKRTFVPRNRDHVHTAALCANG